MEAGFRRPGNVISRPSRFAVGVSIDPDRTEAIRKFPPTIDVKGFARFIGMVNSYHKFKTD
jgi:hypothetical protein